MSSSPVGPSLGFLPAPYLPKGHRVCVLDPGQALDWWDWTGGRHGPPDDFRYYTSYNFYLTKIFLRMEKGVRIMARGTWTARSSGSLLASTNGGNRLLCLCSREEEYRYRFVRSLSMARTVSILSFRAFRSAYRINIFRLLTSVVSAVYGGVYLTAWKFSLRVQETGQLLWKVACFIIIRLVQSRSRHLVAGYRCISDVKYMKNGKP